MSANDRRQDHRRAGDKPDEERPRPKVIGAPTPIRTWNVDQLAHALDVNRDTAYKAVNDGTIPGVRRIGRTIRICRKTVLEWLRGKTDVPRSKE